MAKKEKPSETEAPEVVTQDTPLPESATEAVAEQEVAKPEEETPVAEVQEAEKPDLRALVGGLPDDERKDFLKEVFGEDLKRAEQSGRDSSWNRMETEQREHRQSNQALQDTLKNLEGADDDYGRAGHLQAYGNLRAEAGSQQGKLAALEDMRLAFGLSPAEHRQTLRAIEDQASEQNRFSTFGDYINHVKGERLMEKGDFSTQVQAEVKAQLAEQQGKAIESQAAPVSTGQGEPPTGGLTAEKRRAQSDEEWRKTSPEAIDKMTEKYVAGAT